MILEEIVFKNRNISYGAYYIRKKYYKSVIISLLISILIFITISLLFLYLSYLNQLNIEKLNKKPKIIAAELTHYSLDEIKALAEGSKMPVKKKEIQRPVIKKEEEKPNEQIPENKENIVVSQDTINQEQHNNKEYTDPRMKEKGMFECGSNLLDFRKWFVQNFQFPEDKRIRKNEGRIIAVFSVNEYGIVDSVDIISGIDPIIDDEVKNLLLNSPRWKPCRVNDKETRQIYRFPVFFVRKR